MDHRTLVRLERGQADAVRALLLRAARTDGVSAVNEAGLLHLDHASDRVRHVLVPADREDDHENDREDDRENDRATRLQGYGQLELGADSSTGQLVVDPDHRRRQVGRTLLHRLAELAPGELQVWAFGDLPAARGLAAAEGLQPVRTLLRMTRPLLADLPTPRLPDGVTVRPFVPGADGPAWLGVNARSFASHPEQGAVDAEDLAERMAEPWFDPAGLLLAEREGRLLGSHWTKRHSDALGEVYVLGVDPDAGGRGLGKALLDLGLQHLRDVGVTEVELYVEGDHERAVALYEGRGFAVANRDVMYARA